MLRRLFRLSDDQTNGYTKSMEKRDDEFGNSMKIPENLRIITNAKSRDYFFRILSGFGIGFVIQPRTDLDWLKNLVADGKRTCL